MSWSFLWTVVREIIIGIFVVLNHFHRIKLLGWIHEILEIYREDYVVLSLSCDSFFCFWKIWYFHNNTIRYKYKIHSPVTEHASKMRSPMKYSSLMVTEPHFGDAVAADVLDGISTMVLSKWRTFNIVLYEYICFNLKFPQNSFRSLALNSR